MLVSTVRTSCNAVLVSTVRTSCNAVLVSTVRTSCNAVLVSTVRTSCNAVLMSTVGTSCNALQLGPHAMDVGTRLSINFFRDPHYRDLYYPALRLHVNQILLDLASRLFTVGCFARTVRIIEGIVNRRNRHIRTYIRTSSYFS